MCSKVVKIPLIVKFRCAVKTSFTRRPTPPPRPVSLGWCKNLYPVGQNSPMVLLLLTSDFSQVSVIAIKSTLLSTAKSLSSKALLTIDRELNRRKSLWWITGLLLRFTSLVSSLLIWILIRLWKFTRFNSKLCLPLKFVVIWGNIGKRPPDLTLFLEPLPLKRLSTPKERRESIVHAPHHRNFNFCPTI